MKRGITKREALEAVDGMGAIQASEALAGALANADDIDAIGIRDAMLSIDDQLNEWSKLKKAEVAS